jgi:hypothetical protein
MVTDKLYHWNFKLLCSSTHCSAALPLRQWHKLQSNNEVRFSAVTRRNSSATSLPAVYNGWSKRIMARDIMCEVCISGLSFAVLEDAGINWTQSRRAQCTVTYVLRNIKRERRNCIHTLTWFLPKHETVYCPFKVRSLPCIGLQVSPRSEISAR